MSKSINNIGLIGMGYWGPNLYRNFSNNKSPIKTASVGQARSKIYSTSLKSSTKYEYFLKELFSLL